MRKHIEKLDIKDVELHTPVLQHDGRRGIVDLMLSRNVPRGGASAREHLIVELKRPRLVVTSKELMQIENYALAVVRDERFRAVPARWEFWLITGEFDELVKAKSRQANRPVGLITDNDELGFRVWVKTWGQLLEENRSRMQFIQENLGFEPDHEASLKKLKLRFADLFGKEEGRQDA